MKFCFNVKHTLYNAIFTGYFPRQIYAYNRAIKPDLLSPQYIFVTKYDVVSEQRRKMFIGVCLGNV